MKNIFTLLFLLICSNCFSQFSVDTIIDKNFYKSYFSNDLKNPIYVSTIIWKAGGNCDRSKFSFKNDVTGIKSATLKDYANSGYDQGHLANAADWAFDCDKDEKTFRFYNALPQTPNLNRGIWKKWETNLRKISQNDSLLVLSGGIFSKESNVIGDGVFVPDFCWKVVIRVRTNEVMNVLLFENDSDATVKEIKLSELEKLIGFRPNMNY